MAGSCCQCKDEGRKVRYRDFSDQALAALMVWGEVQSSSIDKGICDPCYSDLREILIDRADEILIAASQPLPTERQQAAKAKIKRTKKSKAA